MSSSGSEMDLTPDFIKEQAQAVVENLLPTVSKERYMKSYNDFMKWRAEKRVKSLSESVFLTYFNELSKKLQPSTLWSTYSMLRTVINTKHDVNIKNYTRLISFLKRQSDGFKCKKSKVFTAQEVETFLSQAPNEIYLATKVALILGISGACRSIELTNLTVEKMEKHGRLHLVKLPNTKTKIDRTFVVQEEFAQIVQKYQDLAQIVQKYQDLRPGNLPTNRFFINYQRGKCLKQVIGRNKISSMPKEIAAYLNLPNANLYTGHCFRRTSATLLADSGAESTIIKRHGGWRSSTVAEGYIEDSVANKSKISNKITEAINLRSTSPQPGSSKDNCDQHEELNNSVHMSTNERMPSRTFTYLPLNDTQISQQVSNITIPGKNLSLMFNNCTNVTVNFK